VFNGGWISSVNSSATASSTSSSTTGESAAVYAEKFWLYARGLDVNPALAQPSISSCQARSRLSRSDT
jgi:hypothetical protein